MAEIFEPGQKALLIDSRGRRYLVTLREGGSFHFHRGIVGHDEIIGREDGLRVKSSEHEWLSVLRPTYADFVLKMPRGAQVVYPKDASSIIVQGDIYPGAKVLEAGFGSGALTMALLRSVGAEGSVTVYELRDDFVETARENIESFMGKTENLDVRMGSIYDARPEEVFDRMVLDVPEPWRALDTAERVLRGGGILASYVPTIIQSQQLSDALGDRHRWVEVRTFETLIRFWNIKGQSVRPEHRMVGHTGFVTTARLISGLS